MNQRGLIGIIILIVGLFITGIIGIYQLKSTKNNPRFQSQTASNVSSPSVTDSIVEHLPSSTPISSLSPKLAIANPSACPIMFSECSDRFDMEPLDSNQYLLVIMESASTNSSAWQMGINYKGGGLLKTQGKKQNIVIPNGTFEINTLSQLLPTLENLDSIRISDNLACPKSASFGTITAFSYKGQTFKGDVQCPFQGESNSLTGVSKEINRIANQIRTSYIPVGFKENQ